MNKLKTVILDDEQTSIDALLWELENFKDRIEILESFIDPDLATSFVNENKVDLVFLDIEMPTCNGFDWLERFDDDRFKVVFTTAYDQFALKAFEAKAYDYLLKPVDEDELLRAITKVDNDKWQDELEQNISDIVLSINRITKKSIAIPTQEGLEFVDLASIIRCESDSNYTRIFLHEEKTILVAKTLKEIEKMIDSEHFFRIHHSHLINLDYLKKYRKGKAGSVVMKDGATVPVSRSRKGDFLNEI